MDWGQELWDQFESVDKHHQHGIDFEEKYSKFVKERCAIEMEYASKVRKLVKSFHPKKRTEDRNIFSTHKAFQSQLAELNDIAGQHETVAEEMQSRICKTLLNFCNDLKLEKKKIYQDGRNQQSVLDQHEKALEQTKKKFEKEWKECERAQAYFEKLNADGNVTKADVEKAKHIWLARKDSVESCKTDYGSALQIFNKEQQEHYSIHMPKLFQLYKEADERRIVKCRELMIDYANIDSAVKPIVQKCLDGMKDAANAIDPKLDGQLVVEKLKSGFLPPSDKEFEDFTQPQQKIQLDVKDGVENSPKNSVNSSRTPNKKGGLSWLFGNKKHGKELKVLLVPKPHIKSLSEANLKRVGQEETYQADEHETTNDLENGGKENKTIFESSPSKTSYLIVDKPLIVESRSLSVDVLDIEDDKSIKSQDSIKNKTSKLKYRIFCVARPNKKKMKSLFRHPKPKLSATLKVSEPVICKTIHAAANDDYLVPIVSTIVPPQCISRSADQENMYDEVATAANNDVEEVVEASDYSHLPPEQRRKKLQKIIDDFKKEINKEEDGRKAIVKMQDVYRSNPALGDADSLAGQIKISTAKIEKLQAELTQHENWYADASGLVQAPSTRGSMSQRSLPTKPTETSVKSPVKTEPLGEEPQQASKPLQKDQSIADDFDEEPEPIGTCVALYDFEASSEGALSMKAGDKFSIVEADNGDGWTRAMQNDVDGYVPTSYIEVNFFT